MNIRYTVVIGVILLLVPVSIFAIQRQEHVQRAADLRALVAAEQLQPIQSPPEAEAALVALGEALFFDRELSGNRDVSCATCHHPALASSDGLALAVGTGGSGFGAGREPGTGRDFVARNSLPLFNRGLPAWRALFWDGRVASDDGGGYDTPAANHLPAGLDNLLAAQAMFPVIIRDEMRGGWYDVAGYSLAPGESPDSPDYEPVAAGWHDVDVYGQPNELAPFGNDSGAFPTIWAKVMERLLEIPGYVSLFQAAYPGTALEQLSFVHAANALAAYQTAAFTFLETPWDRYLAGEEDALTPAAKEGALLFFGDAGCASCHTPPLFTDQEYHNIGAPQFGPGRDDFAPLDYGRYHVTGDPADRFGFRTPSLRNVTLTGPYLHNGAYDSLEAVIAHHLDPEAALAGYDGAQLPPILRATLQNEPVTQRDILGTVDSSLQAPRRLSPAELEALIAFLHALTDPRAADLDDLLPSDVPSGLPLDTP